MRGLGVLSVAALLHGSTGSVTPQPGDGLLDGARPVVDIQPLIDQVARWDSSIGLLNNSPQLMSPGMWFSEAPIEQRAFIRSRDEAYAESLAWLGNDVDRQVRLSFHAFLTDHSKPSWDELRRVLFGYEACLGSLVANFNRLDPEIRPFQLKLPHTDWLESLLAHTEPPGSAKETRSLLHLIEHSETLLRDIRKASRLLTRYHEDQGGVLLLE
jgi:hypothetical protein